MNKLSAVRVKIAGPGKYSDGGGMTDTSSATPFDKLGRQDNHHFAEVGNVSRTSLTPVKAEGPQPLLREIPLGEPFPIDALGPLKEVVQAVHDMTQAS